MCIGMVGNGFDWLFFFFKQKTAYEMLRSLVGSEMCIRDRCNIPVYAYRGTGKTLGLQILDNNAHLLLFYKIRSVSYTHLTLPTIYSV